MKKQMFKLVIFLIPAMLLFSCEKDKFSEKDALDAQQTIDLVINVVDASSGMSPVSGATVRVVVKDSVMTQTTDGSGITIFNKVNIGGNVAVNVSKDSYTSVLTTVNTVPSSYRQSQVSSIIPIYSKDPTKMAIFKGRLTYEGDLTNRKKEVASGVIVKAHNYGLNSSTELIFTDTTDANGNYEIAVPTTSDGDYIELYFPEFTANQKLAFEQDDKTIAVAERTVLYKSGNSATFSIPSIPSIYATISSPTASTVGSGFAMASKANRISLSSIPNFYLLHDGGAGYNSGASGSYDIPFTADKDGNVATLTVMLSSGIITNILGITNNSATYDAMPTLDYSALATQPTTQANIQFFFQTKYNLYITNKGTGYFDYPQVSVEANSFSNYTEVNRVDNDINDGSNDILGRTYLLSNYADIINGQIVSNSSNGDTLTTTTFLASTPVFITYNTPTQKADVAVGTWDINSTDSTLSSLTINNSGYGYDPKVPPTITLTTLGGWGEGAIAKTNVSTSTSLSNVVITNPGKKYVRNVNDWRNNGTTSSSYDNPNYPTTNYYGVNPGDIFVMDVYYGTGYQIVNQSLINK